MRILLFERDEIKGIKVLLSRDYKTIRHLRRRRKKKKKGFCLTAIELNYQQNTKTRGRQHGIERFIRHPREERTSEQFERSSIGTVG